MRQHLPLHGLVAAPHAPFFPDGSLRLEAVEKQAAHLLTNGIHHVFVNGSTGEYCSLSLEERLQIAQRWSEVTRGTELNLVLHVGANAVADSRTLAAQAQRLGAVAISALAPSYFKPRSAELLVECCAQIANAAPEVPFYFYDIPSLTGVSFPPAKVIALATQQIPTFVGLKFTNPDLMAYQIALRSTPAPLDIPWGVDEFLLGALALGAKGAIGSGYNFAAPIYRRLWAAFQRGDLESARTEQYRGVRLIDLFAGLGYMGAAKAVMEMLGVPVGPARLPNGNLSHEQKNALRLELESMGFFDWVGAK